MKTYKPNFTGNSLDREQSLSSGFLYRSKSDPSYQYTPDQLPIISPDATDIIAAIEQSERFFYPNRSLMMSIYERIINNGFVGGIIDKRIDYTLNKPIYLINNKKEKIQLDNIFSSTRFFNDICRFILMSEFYGYGLMTLGDKVGNELQNYDFKKREYINPDLRSFSISQQFSQGMRYDVDPVKDEFLYIHTFNKTSRQHCGQGILYPITIEFVYYLLNRTRQIGYLNMFGVPFVHVKTNSINSQTPDGMVNEDLRRLKQSLANIAEGVLTTPKHFDVEIKETKQAGDNKIFYDFLKETKGSIKTTILGREDSNEAIPGHLGNKTGSDSPEQISFEILTQKDEKFLEDILNDQLLGKLIKKGFNIPIGYKFKVEGSNIQYNQKLDNISLELDVIKKFKEVQDILPQDYLQDKLNIENGSKK